jgi:enoyl-CoA hydratase/carnithine racemase
MSTIDVEQRGRVAIIRMRRPEHGNRVSQQMADEMLAALEDARRSPEVGACVLTGHGEVFCLGGDYWGAGKTDAGRHAFARAFIDMAQAMARLGKPLVAAVNGNAHAGGFGRVVACDMAVVAEDATLGLPEVAKGLFPFLALAIAKDALPKKLLFDIVYRARLIDAAEAKGLHVVNEVVARGAVLDRAVALAEQASAHNPAILRLGRDLYYNMRNMSPAQALEESGFALLAALAAEDEARGG